MKPAFVLLWSFLLCCAPPGFAATADLSAAGNHGSYPDRFAASKDLNEFIEQRAALPAAGSYFYAYLVRWECFDDAGIARRVEAQALADPDARRVAAVRRELERCRNVSVSVSASPMQRRDIEDGRSSGDKLFGLWKGDRGRWFSAADRSDLDKAFSFFARSDDPNMVWVVAQQLAQFSNRMSIDGRPLNDVEGRALYTAFMLSACDRGVDCGPTHRWRRNLCVHDGDCELGLEAAWRRGNTEKDPKAYWELVARYRARISAAASSGDWSSFVLTESAGRSG